MRDKYTGDVKGKKMYKCQICGKAFVAFPYDIESFNREIGRHRNTDCKELPNIYPSEEDLKK